MRGLMMDTPLLISSIIRHAAAAHGWQEVVSRTVEGPLHRYTYRDAYGRIQRLANALVRLGVKPGDRVATLAWNGHRHLELYYAVSGIGAVCHTINPRLFRDQITYIVNHARDRWLFLDPTFVPLVEELAPGLAPVEGYVVMTDAAHMPPEARLPGAPRCYEELVAAEEPRFEWPVFDERTASSLCYTSGTTGNPKGVLYSHRSTLLHTFSVLVEDGVRMGRRAAALPVVPMFHVNAWGLPYVAPLSGTKLVLPGPRLDGASLLDLIARERVTAAWGVPTVWLGLLDEARRTNTRLESLQTMVIGGSAVPRAMIKEFDEVHGVDVCHGWGMTEMSPVGAVCVLPPGADDLPPERRYDLKVKQGRPTFGVEMKIVGPDGERLPHDGRAFGELLVRGPFVLSAYYEDPEGTAAAFDDEGWFRTGDVATIDPDGYMQIVDRTKDVISSGGEWISSIDLENAAMGHPAVAEAAAIAVAHPKWGERPLLLVVPRPGTEVSRQDILDHLADSVAKWWLPDDVVFVDELPHTATGKLLKSELRRRYKDHRLPTAPREAGAPAPTEGSAPRG